MDKKVFEGRNLEEALQEASKTLGIAEPELDYEIIEQGRRGLFGIGAKSVRIRVMPPISPLEPQAAELLGVPVPGSGSRRRDGGRSRRPGRERPEGRPDGRQDGRQPGRQEGPRDRSAARREPRESREPRDRPAAPPRSPVSEEDLRKIEGTAQEIIDLMGLQLKVEAAASDAGVDLELAGSDEELLSDSDSELASSLQFILNRMARRTWPDAGRIRLGDNGRPSGRDGEVIDLVREVAQQVLQTGETKRLHAMNAYERRLVHLTIRQTQGLGSKSEGDGAMKQVRIFKQDKKPRSGRSRSRRGRGRKRTDA